jgi:putative nucleotidyltransferase with HDIG domain
MGPVADQLEARTEPSLGDPRNEAEAVLRCALAHRVPDLEAHGASVSSLAEAVARKLGLDEDERAAIVCAAELHDVGKMAIPDEVLAKPGPLDQEDWALMRRHTILGERIVSEASSLAQVAEIIRSSHERWDGNGYPDGLQGEEIPLASRIVFVCDAFDAMTSQRPYQATRTPQEALEELRLGAGSQFDPELVEVFAAALSESAVARV